MERIFLRIATGEIPCFKVAEDENHLAFLDINPLAIGHTLVIPKKETDYLFDLDTGSYVELMKFTRRVALAIRSEVDCIRIGVVVYGLDVPHAHIHLIPLHGNNDIDFKKPKVKLSEEEFKNIAKNIRENFGSGD